MDASKRSRSNGDINNLGIYTMEDEFLFHLGRFTKWVPRKDVSLYITEFAKLQSQYHIISSS
jgi:hypothetical protein